ncbi:hypothetical protein MNBD_GAMMA07-2653 [hydrothermal vent metagenome]|uniref:DUF3549 domain-containing protein n=1 Tax=hydrothermal vent metagenome TaxID=652676 RepID=A0A3B0XJD6_9ZZZZ
MTQINGICDFLNQAGTEFKVFDMGRRIEEINRADFLRFELGEIPYPLPLQQQAWLGFLVWSEDKRSELVIWFLRFPLDTTGKLTSGIRDDFVARLLDKKGDETPQQDESNPYGFKPKQEHMASFHAKAAKLLEQPASHYYESTRDYFVGKTGYDEWQHIGFQGIADIISRLDEDNNAELISQVLAEIPDQPFEALTQCLEHEKINTQLSQAIVNVITRELGNDNSEANYISLCIRALSNTQDQTLLELTLNKILALEIGSHPEILASISGRCWLTLKNNQTISLFLEALARCTEGQNFFNLVIVDLINIPGMQDSIPAAIRLTERSENLSKAIGGLFKSFT